MIGHGSGMSGHYLLTDPGLESLTTIEIEPVLSQFSTADHLPLLQEMDIIQNLELLEDFDAIAALSENGDPPSTIQ